jgi:hypothetical protein
MFNGVVHKAGFLKHLPLAPALFDGLLLLWGYCFNRQLVLCLEELEEKVREWEHIQVKRHRFGGTQFDFHGKELGHIHSNGLLDVLLTRNLKTMLVQAGRGQEHHVFKQSGWVSFYIRSKEDILPALEILQIARSLKITDNP